VVVPGTGGPDNAEEALFCAALLPVLFSVRSSADYDPAPMLDRIRAPLLAINFEEDMLNAVQVAPMVRQALAAVSSARFELVPGGFRHSSIYHAELWSGPMAVFLDGLPGWKTE
jgi:homoserine O-acetyltransferase